MIPFLPPLPRKKKKRVKYCSTEYQWTKYIKLHQTRGQETVSLHKKHTEINLEKINFGNLRGRRELSYECLKFSTLNDFETKI